MAAESEQEREIDRALAAHAAARSTLEILTAARQVRAQAQALELDAVEQARAEGISWSKIGGIYGLTKQGAQQRFKAALQAKGSAAGPPETVPEEPGPH